MQSGGVSDLTSGIKARYLPIECNESAQNIPLERVDQKRKFRTSTLGWVGRSRTQDLTQVQYKLCMMLVHVEIYSNP